MDLEPKSFLLDQALFDYMVAHSMPPTPVQRDLIAATRDLGDIAGMQIGIEQGVFFTLLTRALGVREAIEVGTFTGYSAMSIALGLPAGGRLLCCDVSEEWVEVGRRHWEAAGVADRIEVRIGPALDTLRALPDDARFDLAFLDADKPGYVGYFDEVVPRLRTGGVLLADNVLQGGRVVDHQATSSNLDGIRVFNEHVAADTRVDAVVLPIGDGLTLAVKR
jgi:caffeoyl-CoA O-methyltransferase